MIAAVILGIVQGLTEFIPVSSTAHLVILPRFLGGPEVLQSLSFDVALHFGTTLALLGFFWRDWMEILTARRRLLWLIVLGCVPVGVVGLAFKDWLELHLRQLWIIASTLVAFGGVMLVAERFGGGKRLSEMSLRDALVIGAAQVLALVPGVSRSGITISAGLFAGYRRADAARFSFLLSTPAILGATLLESRKILHGLDAGLDVFGAGFLSSLIAGWAALGFLMKYLEKRPVNVFVYYRFFLAAGVILIMVGS